RHTRSRRDWSSDVCSSDLFDGDGDRLIAVDEKGNIVDGDQIMYICATHLAQNGMLKNDTIVTTVMSNLGLHKALEARGINVVTTKVGDRYVMESMRDGADRKSVV